MFSTHYYVPHPPWQGSRENCLLCGKPESGHAPTRWWRKRSPSIFKEFLDSLDGGDARSACESFMCNVPVKEVISLVLGGMYEKSKQVQALLAIVGMLAGPQKDHIYRLLHSAVMIGPLLSSAEEVTDFFDNPVVISVLEGLRKHRGFRSNLLEECPLDQPQAVAITGSLLVLLEMREWGWRASPLLSKAKKVRLPSEWLGVLTRVVYKATRKVSRVYEYRSLANCETIVDFWIQCAPIGEVKVAYWRELLESRSDVSFRGPAIAICCRHENQLTEVVESFVPYILKYTGRPLTAADVTDLEHFLSLPVAKSDVTAVHLADLVRHSFYRKTDSVSNFTRLLDGVVGTEGFATYLGQGLVAWKSYFAADYLHDILLGTVWIRSVPQHLVRDLILEYFRKLRIAQQRAGQLFVQGALAVTMHLAEVHLDKDTLSKSLGVNKPNEVTESSLRALVGVLPPDESLWLEGPTTTYHVLTWSIEELVVWKNHPSVATLRGQVTVLLEECRRECPLGMLLLLSRYVVHAVDRLILWQVVAETTFWDVYALLMEDAAAPPEVVLGESLTRALDEHNRQLQGEDLTREAYANVLEELGCLQRLPVPSDADCLYKRAEWLIGECDRVEKEFGTAVTRLEWVVTHAVKSAWGWIDTAKRSHCSLEARKAALVDCTNHLDKLCGGKDRIAFLLRVFVETPTGTHSSVAKAFLRQRMQQSALDPLHSFGDALERTQGDLVRFLKGNLKELAQAGEELFSRKLFLGPLNTENEKAVLGQFVEGGRTIRQTVTLLNFLAHKDCVADVLTKVVGLPEDDAEVASLTAGELDEQSLLLPHLLRITDEMYEVFVAVLEAEELMHYVKTLPEGIADRVVKLLERASGKGDHELAVSLLHNFKLLLPVLLPLTVRGKVTKVLRAVGQGVEGIKGKVHLGQAIRNLNTNVQRLEEVVEKGEVKSKTQSSKEQLERLLRERCYYRMVVSSQRAAYTIVDERGNVLSGLCGDALEDFVQQVCFVVEAASHVTKAVTFGRALVDIDTLAREAEKPILDLASRGKLRYVGYAEQWEIKPETPPTMKTRAELKRKVEKWEATYAAANARGGALNLLLRQHVASLMAESCADRAVAEFHSIVVPLAAGGLAVVKEMKAYTTAKRPFRSVEDLDAAASSSLHLNTDVLRRPKESPSIRVIRYERDASFASMMASVLERFSRVPYPFEVLDCTSCGATRAAVNLFIQRMTELPGGEYVVMGAHLLPDDARDSLAQFVHGCTEERGSVRVSLTICTEGGVEDFPSSTHVAAQRLGCHMPRKEDKDVGSIVFVTGGRGVGKSRYCDKASTCVVHIYDAESSITALKQVLEPLQERACTPGEEKMTVWVDISEFAFTGKLGPLPVNMVLMQLLYLRYVVTFEGVLLVPKRLAFVVEVPEMRGTPPADQLKWFLPLALMLGKPKRMDTDLIKSLEVRTTHRNLAFFLDCCRTGTHLENLVKRLTNRPVVELKGLFEAWNKHNTDDDVRKILGAHAHQWASNYLLLDNWVTTVTSMLSVVGEAPFAFMAAGCGLRRALAVPLAEVLVPGLVRQAEYFVQPDQVLTHSTCLERLGMLLVTSKDGTVTSVGEVSPSMQALSVMFQGTEATYRELQATLRGQGVEVDRSDILVAQLLTKGREVYVSMLHDVLRKLEFLVTEDILVRVMSVMERQRSGAPLILVSESGVGKTFLLKVVQEILGFVALCECRIKVSGAVEKFVRELCTRVLGESKAKGLRVGTPSEMCNELVKLQGEAEKKRDHAAIPLAVLAELQKVVKNHPYAVWEGSLWDRIQQGVGVIDLPLFEMALKPQMSEVFFKLLIHSGLTPEDVARWMARPLAAAKSLDPDEQKANESFVELQGVKVTVFFDELNTSACPGFLKTLMVDRRLGGKLLPKNIFFVASINPRGQGYNVDQLPYPMEVLTQRLEPLRNEDMGYFIHEALLRSAQSLWKEDEILDKTTKLIDVAHRTVEGWCQSGRLSETSHFVSQRDIQRVKNMSASIYKLSNNATKGRIGNTDNLVESVVTAVYFAYLARFEVESSEYINLLTTLDNFLGTAGISGNVSNIKSETVDRVVNEDTVAIDEGISLSGSLAENIFVTLVAVVSTVPKVAVGIVGKPGTGKTLSVRLLQKNMKGEQAATPFFKRLKKLVLLTLQASSSTSGRQVAKVFADAQLKQEVFADSAYVLVCIDEAGLPEDETRVLKAMHEPLDTGDVACVVLSNRPLDKANQNRLNTVYCGEATPDDVSRLTCGCLGLSVRRYEYERARTTGKAAPEMLRVINGLTRAYFAISRMWGGRYHNRNYIYLLRYLALMCQFADFTGTLDCRELRRGVEHNYGGGTKEQMWEVLQTFFAEMGWEGELVEDDLRSPVEVLRDSVRRRVGGDMSVHLRPRNVLLVDPSPDYCNVARVQGELGAVCEVFCSNLKGDAQVNEDTRTLNRIVHAMETGGHVLLYNGHRILGNLFDVLNQNFTATTVEVDGECKTLYFAKVAMGSETYECMIHDTFRLSIAMSEKEFREKESQVTWAPFLSRFEVVLLPSTPGDVGLEGLEERVERFAEHVGLHNIQPRGHTGTVPSVVGLDGSVRTANIPLDIATQEGVAAYQCNATLLQAVSPEAVLLAQPQLVHGREYSQEYFAGQEHFSIKRLVERVRGQPPKGCSCTPWFVTTNDRYNAAHLEKVLDGTDVTVIRADLLEMRSELEGELQRRNGDLVVVVAKFARDIEVVNLMRHVLSKHTAQMHAQRFVALLVVGSAFPTTFSSGWRTLYMDTLRCHDKVLSMMKAGCGLESAVVPPQSSLWRQVYHFLTKHTVACAATSGKNLAEGGVSEAAVEFYMKGTGMERRATLLLQTVDEADLRTAISGLQVEEARVRDIMHSTAERCVRGESTGPFAVALGDAVQQEMERPVHRVLAGLVAKKGLFSLARSHSTPGVCARQIALCKRAVLLFGRTSHERRRAARDWDFVPACLYNPWFHQILTDFVNKHCPAEKTGVEKAALVLEQKAREEGLVDTLDVDLGDDLLLKDFVHDALRVACNFRCQGRDVRLDDTLLELLLAEFRDRGAATPMQVAFVVTSLHLFPETLCDVLGYRSIVALVMGLVGAGRDAMPQKEAPDLFVGKAIEVLRGIDPTSPHAMETVRKVCQAHCVLRTYLVDRENKHSPKCNWRLWVLDMVCYVCSHKVDKGVLLQVVHSLCREPAQGRDAHSLKGVVRLISSIPDNEELCDVKRQTWVEMLMLWLGTGSAETIAGDTTLPGFLFGVSVDRALPCLTDRRHLTAIMHTLAHCSHSTAEARRAKMSLEACLVKCLEDAVEGVDLGDTSFAVPHQVGQCTNAGVDAFFELLVSIGTEKGLAAPGAASAAETALRISRACGNGKEKAARVVEGAALHIFVNTVPHHIMQHGPAQEAVAVANHPFLVEVGKSEDWQVAFVARMIGSSSVEAVRSTVCLMADTMSESFAWCARFKNLSQGLEKRTEDILPLLPDEVFGKTAQEVLYNTMCSVIASKEWGRIGAMEQECGVKEVSRTLLHVALVEYYEKGLCGQLLELADHLRKVNPLGWGPTHFRLLSLFATPDKAVGRVASVLGVQKESYQALGLDMFHHGHPLPEELCFRRCLLLFAVYLVGCMEGGRCVHHFHQIITDPTLVKKEETCAFGDKFSRKMIHGWDCGSTQHHEDSVIVASYCYIYMSLVLNGLLHPELLETWLGKAISEKGASSEGVVAALEGVSCNQDPCKVFLYAKMAAREYWGRLDHEINGVAHSLTRIATFSHLLTRAMAQESKEAAPLYRSAESRMKAEREFTEQYRRALDGLGAALERRAGGGLLAHLERVRSVLPGVMSGVIPKGEVGFFAQHVEGMRAKFRIVQLLPRLLELYKLLHYELCFRRGELFGKDGKDPLTLREVVIPRAESMVRDGVEAYNLVVGILGNRIDAECVEETIEAISDDTPVLSLLTYEDVESGVEEDGLLLNLVKKVLKVTDELRVVFQDFADSTENTTHSDMSWVVPNEDMRDTGKALMWVVERCAGMLNGRFGEQMRPAVKMALCGGVDKEVTRYLVLEVGAKLSLARFAVEDVRQVHVLEQDVLRTSDDQIFQRVDEQLGVEGPEVLDLPLKVHDFCMEVPHGTLREVRTFLVVVAELLVHNPADTPPDTPFRCYAIPPEQHDPMVQDFCKLLPESVAIRHAGLLHRAVTEILARRSEQCHLDDARARFGMKVCSPPEDLGAADQQLALEVAQKDTAEIIEDLGLGMETLVNYKACKALPEGSPIRKLADIAKISLFEYFPKTVTMRHRVHVYALLRKYLCSMVVRWQDMERERKVRYSEDKECEREGDGEERRGEEGGHDEAHLPEHPMGLVEHGDVMGYAEHEDELEEECPTDEDDMSADGDDEESQDEQRRQADVQVDFPFTWDIPPRGGVAFSKVAALRRRRGTVMKVEEVDLKEWVLRGMGGDLFAGNGVPVGTKWNKVTLQVWDCCAAPATLHVVDRADVTETKIFQQIARPRSQSGKFDCVVVAPCGVRVASKISVAPQLGHVCIVPKSCMVLKDILVGKDKRPVEGMPNAPVGGIASYLGLKGKGGVKVFVDPRTGVVIPPETLWEKAPSKVELKEVGEGPSHALYQATVIHKNGGEVETRVVRKQTTLEKCMQAFDTLETFTCSPGVGKRTVRECVGRDIPIYQQPPVLESVTVHLDVFGVVQAKTCFAFEVGELLPWDMAKSRYAVCTPHGKVPLWLVGGETYQVRRRLWVNVRIPGISHSSIELYFRGTTDITCSDVVEEAAKYLCTKSDTVCLVHALHCVVLHPGESVLKNGLEQKSLLLVANLPGMHHLVMFKRKGKQLEARRFLAEARTAQVRDFAAVDTEQLVEHGVAITSADPSEWINSVCLSSFVGYQAPGTTTVHGASSMFHAELGDDEDSEGSMHFSLSGSDDTREEEYCIDSEEAPSWGDDDAEEAEIVGAARRERVVLEVELVEDGDLHAFEVNVEQHCYLDHLQVREDAHALQSKCDPRSVFKVQVTSVTVNTELLCDVFCSTRAVVYEWRAMRHISCKWDGGKPLITLLIDESTDAFRTVVEFPLVGLASVVVSPRPCNIYNVVQAACLHTSFSLSRILRLDIVDQSTGEVVDTCRMTHDVLSAVDITQEAHKVVVRHRN